MASKFDESDFIDSDYESAKSSVARVSPQSPGASDVRNRPPSREELESKVSETQQRLIELKRAQEELERERAGLEEARRRKVELQTGREEMVEHLTRGVALLEESEFAARRDAEQMAKTLTDLRDSLAKVQAIREETWSQENWTVELTRALTTIENARMEWNGARLKWAVLNGSSLQEAGNIKQDATAAILESRGFWQLCKLGFALTWPLALIGLTGIAIALFVLSR